MGPVRDGAASKVRVQGWAEKEIEVAVCSVVCSTVGCWVCWLGFVGASGTGGLSGKLGFGCRLVGLAGWGGGRKSLRIVNCTHGVKGGKGEEKFRNERRAETGPGNGDGDGRNKQRVCKQENVGEWGRGLKWSEVRMGKLS